MARRAGLLSYYGSGWRMMARGRPRRTTPRGAAARLDSTTTSVWCFMCGTCE